MAVGTSKTLYLAGKFDTPVSVNAQFTQGSGCEASGESSCAGGVNSSASGEAAYARGKGNAASGTAAVALGNSASADHGVSFVWNGKSSEAYASKGDGTFCINPNGGADGFFIGDKTLSSIVEGLDIDAKNHTWTGQNTFREKTVNFATNVVIENGKTLTASNATMNLKNATTLVASVPDNASSVDQNTAANVKYVKDSVNNFLKMDNVWSGVQTFEQTIQGVALRAKWADLAEYYEADRSYPPGTLVKFGGEKEITAASDGVVNAVVSSKPGLILGQKKNSDYALIALCGRVPVRVVGPCRKFDRLYLSKVDGCAIAKCEESATPIGIALESKDRDEPSVVQSVVKLTL